MLKTIYCIILLCLLFFEQDIWAQSRPFVDKFQLKSKTKYAGKRIVVNTVKGIYFSTLDHQNEVQLFYLNKSGKRKYKAYASAKLLLNNILNANKYSLLILSDQSIFLQRTLFNKPLYQSGIPMQDTTVIHSIIKCDAVFRQKTRFERIVLERCVKGDVSGHFGQPDLESAPIKIRGMLVTDIITKFKKKYKKVDIKSSLPRDCQKFCVNSSY